MEPLFHIAPKSQEQPELKPISKASSGNSPWSKAGLSSLGAPASSAREALRRDRAMDYEYPSVRRLDNSRIANQVIMSQRLSRQEEKNLHFIIQRYRLLCNRMMEVARNLGSQVFLITSAIAEEGKTLTAANLAFALSGIENKKTLLIDLDLRRFSLHSLLGLPSALQEDHFLLVDDWHKSLWSLRPGLDALLATTAADHPDEMLHSSALRSLLDTARIEYDYVLIDSAPLLLAADTHALLPFIDQAMLVVRADRTPMACSQDSLKILGDKAVGCILNDVKRLKYQAYYHGYYGAEERK